jgi:RND superfamily putative drug exporter
MAVFLFRLGRASFRRRRLVLLGWLVVAAATVALSVNVSGKTVDGFSIPGTPAQEAINLLEQRFPEAGAGGASANIVFAAPAGTDLTDTAPKQKIRLSLADLSRAGQVANIVEPYEAEAVSDDHRIAYARVVFTVPAADLNDSSRQAIARAVSVGRNAGLTVEVGGDAVESSDSGGLSEVIGVAGAAMILMLTFGSLLAAGLPLLTALFGVTIGLSLVTIGSGIWELSSETSTLALMLGLAVAIDYALFIVSRYRSELRAGRAKEDAIGQATGTAGSAVVFAGLTVVIALTGLTLSGVPLLAQMGLAAAVTVVFCVLIALTLLPAMLGFTGDRIFGRRARRKQAADGFVPVQDESRTSLSGRWVNLVVGHPLVVVLGATALLAVMSAPALDLRLGLPDDGQDAPASSTRKAYDLLSAGFGPGFNGPLTVVLDASAAPGSAETAAPAATELITALPDVDAVEPAVVNPAGDTAILSVIPSSGPDDAATTTLVSALRALSPQLQATTGATIAVTGLTAINIDLSDKLASALIVYLLVVVGLAVLLLALLFRSVLVPLKAALGFLLTMGATFGTVVAVFQKGWLASFFGVEQTGPVVSYMPIILIAIVFGLAMDYEVFLVSRMREVHASGLEPVDAVVSGFTHNAKVITAAALIMVSVFFGFVLTPNASIKMLGFGLASAIVFDAFIVRMTIVPAVMALLGRAAWWLPSWADRLLPNVDIEGENLRGPDRTAGPAEGGHQEPVVV